MPYNLYAVTDPDRAIVATTTLLSLLADDPRVQAALREWLPRAAPTPSMRSDLHATCARLVFGELRVPFPWLADWLEAIFFRIALAGEPVPFLICEPTRSLDPLPGEPLALTIRRTTRQGRRPNSRRPQHRGATLARDVTYWYLHELADPPISIHALARGYRRMLTSRGDADADRKTVREAIHRAGTILHQIGCGGGASIMLLLVGGDLSDR